MASAKPVKIPDIGGFSDVPVIEVLVSPGDTVEAEQPLIVLESDKSTMEIPAPEAGTIESVALKVDDKVSEGDTICQIVPAEAASPAPAPEPEAAPAAEPEPEPSPEAAAQPEPEPEPAPAAEASVETVRVPDIGDFTDVPVIEVLVSAGDSVEADQPLIVLESEKSTMEVPSPKAGTVESVSVKVDDKLKEGDAICELRVAGKAEAAPAPQAAAPEPAPAAKKEASPAPKSEDKADSQAEEEESAAQGPRMRPEGDGQLIPHASPAVRRFARELGVDLAQVSGSGAKGRILREDVQQHVKSAMKAAPQAAAATAGGGGGLPQQPEVDFSRFGPVEAVDLARIRRISAQNLHRNWLLVPHVTQTDSADITDLEAFRKAESMPEQKLTLLPFLIKAVAQCLRDFPDFNASLSADGQQLIRKQYCHIGFAADTPNGLLVPVIRDVWSKSVTELAAESGALAAKARDGKLKPDEMQGGCFSISSLGGIGGSHFSPIVNAPEVAILGVSKASMQPVWDGEAFQPRLMCPLSLSYDHRVIDGAAAARFIVQLKTLLEDLRRLLL